MKDWTVQYQCGREGRAGTTWWEADGRLYADTLCVCGKFELRTASQSYLG